MKLINSTLMILGALVSASVSCSKDPIVNREPSLDTKDEIVYLRVKQPEETKIVYADSLGTTGSTGTFTMQWEEGDSLYAIMWQGKPGEQNARATNKYIILTTTQQAGSEGEMLFQGSTKGGWSLSELQGGEHFVLVHGHFVLDEGTDGGVLDFPTSEVTKAGYASKIHHGGITEGTALTFRNQDGTLANLKKHEYMVGDACIRFDEVQEDDGNGGTVTVRRPYLASSPDSDTPVTMRSAHTLLRLTMFMPDNMFNSIDYRLLAVSLRTADNSKIFHRYFRLHPNQRRVEDGKEVWTADWNTNADKESNSYLRLNMPGTRRYDEINDPTSQSFDPSKTVCVTGTLGTGESAVTGHFVTLYFSLPSRALAPSNDDGSISSDSDSKLIVTAFTRTHAYRVTKKYTISRDFMKPGHIVKLNVNFANNHLQIPAITDPNLGVTFAPGIVYATRQNTSVQTWSYGIYTNQGEYAGLNQQTDCMGDYFIFGSIDPRQVFHQHKNKDNTWSDCTYWNSSWTSGALSVTLNPDGTIQSTNDVAALATFGGINNIFSTMSQKEAERVWKRINEEAKNGVNKGFYYYDAAEHDTDALHHTAHQAIGAWENLDANDPRRAMSSSMGIWIGINRQPTLEEQDMYVFLPSSHQLNNRITNMQWYDSNLHEWFSDDTETGEEAGYENVESHRYAASADYGKQHVFCYEGTLPTTEISDDFANIATRLSNGTILNHYYLKTTRTVGKTKEYGLKGTDYRSMIMKFSTNTRDISGSLCQRFQVWYSSGSTFQNSGIAPMDQTFGRVVRPVIY